MNVSENKNNKNHVCETITPEQKETQSSLNRSVMLTRFKLSQQKRQLREKDRRMTHITQLLKRPNLTVTDDKTSVTQKAVTSPKQSKSLLNPSKKGKLSQTKKLQREEFCPNKVKRNSIAKKIVLKPKHELKLIGGTNGVNKRKLNLPQKGMKSPPPKRHKTFHKFFKSFNSSFTITDRSQSPIYSELSFEEVIRMADENQSLDDEDLLEILTCPSPVWWEDPPSDGYVEDPITKTPKTKTSTLPVKQCKIKSSRKKKPHKIILELPKSNEGEAMENTVDVGSIVDTPAYNNSDDKFKNKRSKLENLLSSIKNKLSDPKTKQDYDTKPQEASVREKRIDNAERPEIHRSARDGAQKTISESSEDCLFNDISLQDNDDLTLLENIEIPIEGKKDDISSQTEESADVKIPKGMDMPSTNPSEHLKIFRKDLFRTTYVRNKKLKIINIKKVPANLYQNKEQRIDNFLIPSFPIESTISSECSDANTNSLNREVLESNANLMKVDEVIDLIDNEPSTEAVNNTMESGIYLDSTDLGVEVPQDETEEYITVFKIVSNDPDIPADDGSFDHNDVVDETENPIVIKHSSETEETTNALFDETETVDKNKINAYYKNCKNSRRAAKKNTKPSSKDDNGTAQLPNSNGVTETLDNYKELCDECNKDVTTSIVVSNTRDVKYCMICSSIFDMDQCNYCIRKEKEKQKHRNQPDLSNDEVKVNKEYVKDDV